MPYTNVEARKQLLDALGEAADSLAQALAFLGAAYEHLDDQQADRLEEQLFRPVQHAYGRAKRTHAEFASRHGLPEREFKTPSPGAPSTGVKELIENAVDAIGHAEAGLVALQDSLMPIEFGDADLRTGLTEVRRLIDGISQRARAFVRTYGR
jgi:phage gp29-like protein